FFPLDLGADRGTSRPRSGTFRRRTMATVQPSCSLPPSDQSAAIVAIAPEQLDAGKELLDWLQQGLGSRLDRSGGHRTGALQEGEGIMDMLPGVIAPGADTFGEDPPSHRAGRDGRKAGILGHAMGQFGS